MSDPLFWHRLQFGLTATFHYLFPQLTMGLALLVVIFKSLGLRRNDPVYHDLARFWIRILGITFATGVVTGIPLEIQFGANWARFTRHTGGVIGQTLAMEGMFAFFLESSFLGLLIWGERKLGPRRHFWAAVALFLGTWLSGYFIVATSAFMQHPVGYSVAPDGSLQLASFWTYLVNPWALIQYAHTMLGSVVTASFVLMSMGAFWLLQGKYQDHGRRNLSIGALTGLLASLLVAFPTGDLQGKLVARHQPATLATMEGRFKSGSHAELTLVGQPNFQKQQMDNPLTVPGVLSFIAYGSFSAQVPSVADFPLDQRPTSPELLFYSFHIMVALGGLFIALTGLAAFLLRKGRLERSRPMLWALLLAFPLPYLANTAGWMTTELGRQPWLIYGLFRTAEGSSHLVHAGQSALTVLGFSVIYLILGLLYLYLVLHEVSRGPLPENP